MKIQGPLVVYQMSFAADAAATGIGIGLIGDTYFGWVRHGGLRGRQLNLVRILPEYRVVGSELSLISPPTDYEPARVRLLRDFLTSKLRPMMQACALAVAADKADRGQKRKRRGRQPSPPLDGATAVAQP